jgi:bacillithiol system protein YtxJ
LSAERPVLLFKHSTACPISAEAFRQVAGYVAQAAPSQPDVYLVKVIEDRPVSNQIADQLRVAHKSPQLLLVKDRTVLWWASHYGINLKAVQEALAKHLPTHA